MTLYGLRDCSAVTDVDDRIAEVDNRMLGAQVRDIFIGFDLAQKVHIDWDALSEDKDVVAAPVIPPPTYSAISGCAFGGIPHHPLPEPTLVNRPPPLKRESMTLDDDLQPTVFDDSDSSTPVPSPNMTNSCLDQPTMTVVPIKKTQENTQRAGKRNGKKLKGIGGAFKCTQCTTTCTKERNLRRHMRSHNPHKQYQCPRYKPQQAHHPPCFRGSVTPSTADGRSHVVATTNLQFHVFCNQGGVYSRL
jgi:hypothetical protein